MGLDDPGSVPKRTRGRTAVGIDISPSRTTAIARIVRLDSTDAESEAGTYSKFSVKFGTNTGRHFGDNQGFETKIKCTDDPMVAPENWRGQVHIRSSIVDRGYS